jgi:hypothetical protein
MDLDMVAQRAKALGRYEFQVMMAPLVALRPIASPVNPIAVFQPNLSRPSLTDQTCGSR